MLLWINEMEKELKKNIREPHQQDPESGTVDNGTQGEERKQGSNLEDDNTKNRRRKRCYNFLKKFLVMLTICAVLIGFSATIWFYFGWQWYLTVFVWAFGASLVFIYRIWLYVALKTAPRDLRALYGFIRLLIQGKRCSGRNQTIADIFQENVKKHPQKPCILFEDQSWDFQQVEHFSNKIANTFQNAGFKKGDVVSLLMENRPEFIATWLGLSKLGIIVPLINTNQRQGSLIHSITIVSSQAIVVSAELADAVSEILDQLNSKVLVYQLDCKNNTTSNFHNLNNLLQEASKNPPVVADKPGHHDRLVYIYTSGTTGLPKAAVISNARYLFIASAIHWLARFKHSDRFYAPLPLYHTAGGCMSVGQMLIFGSSLVIRKKFSASQYFSDCEKYQCTIGHYIGEMCRYILAAPPQPSDTKHSVRLVYGNGLRPQNWNEFVTRFKIKRVAEFYGATEGNANIVNVDNTVGAIGFISRIIPAVYPISIIRCDPLSGEPIRNSKGLCIECKANEPGVFIGKIVPNNPTRAFLGYVDEGASKKKVVHDVFTKGDSAFLSGDIIVADELGNLFFKDRTGDTFRWKGENVSTLEVEGVLSNLVDYKDVVVYGVELKNQEGRAGMAAILDPEENVNLANLAEGCKKALPFYARPIFIRILNQVDMTGTYKLRKLDLQKEGFNVNEIKDNIYYLDSKGSYILVTPDVYDKINNGLIRV